MDIGISWTLRTQPDNDADLLFVDTMGELSDFYAVAQVAFVGGSLVPAGGQNILETVARNVPTIHGPHMENFLWALDVVKGHTSIVKNAIELRWAIVGVLTETERYSTMAKTARESLVQAQGITMRYIYLSFSTEAPRGLPRGFLNNKEGDCIPHAPAPQNTLRGVS